ncbi:Rap1a/Tai family immunity protein [Tibeticola sp.]|jgi:hypothetical protein|uniref:Rap1a/Tai family immunity protein n=1 Tax=Tibeticola sp. TaxID=2005368 RepID=UPI00258B5539|nr:Rap1a/Tai family immunity protein [Tibeticola sp.]MCI4440424.1 hypothetical protein [Tibeticola sp.]
MKRSIFLLIILALGLVPPAGAQGYSLTGNDFLRMCDGPFSNDVEKLMYASFCTGYLQGLQQMHHIVVGVRNVQPLYCEPTQSGNYDQLERVVVKWLKNNPEHLHRDARVLVTRALMEAFPCR